MVYLPTFTLKINQLQENIQYMDPMGRWFLIAKNNLTKVLRQEMRSNLSPLWGEHQTRFEIKILHRVCWDASQNQRGKLYIYTDKHLDVSFFR